MLNPILKRETRTALRTWKTYIVIMVYVLCLLGVTGQVLAMMLHDAPFSGFDPREIIYLYIIIAAFQLGLILLIVPALAGGAISGERERQTLDLLLVTPMSALSIVVGKLCASLLVVALMIAASLPVYGVMLYYGSITFGQLLAMGLFFLNAAALAGAAAVFFSALFKRSIIAIVMTYFAIGVLTLGTLLALLVFNWYVNDVLHLWMPRLPVYALVGANPFFGFVSVIDSLFGMTAIDSFIYDGMLWRQNFVPLPIPLWVINGLFNALSAAGLCACSAAILRSRRR